MSRNSVLRSSAAITALFALTATANGSEGSVRYWILQGPRLEAQAMATDSEDTKFFSAASRVVLYPVVARVSPPPSWHVIRWRKYTSFERFQQDVLDERVPAGTEVVGYDNEKWELTPANEKADPTSYTIEFAKLAHAHGYKMIAMPAENLMERLAPRRNKYAAFLEYGFAKAVAPYVDFYHVQAQGLQQNVNGREPSYSGFVRAVAEQVHAVNPNVVITAGISTNTPGGARVTTPQDIAAAVRSVDSFVSGYWLNVVGGNTRVASQALTLLDSGGSNP